MLFVVVCMEECWLRNCLRLLGIVVILVLDYSVVSAKCLDVFAVLLCWLPDKVESRCQHDNTYLYHPQSSLKVRIVVHALR